jgi:hypothetical protein
MVEHADGEQTSVVFLGRESFRIERRVPARVSADRGAIPTPISDTPTGRIFDRRRAPRHSLAVDAAASARRTRSLVALLVITFAGGVVVASAITGMRTRAVPPRPRLAPPAAAAPPVAPAAAPAVRQPPPADEPTPAGVAAPTSTIPDRPAAVPPAPRLAPRPARPAVRSPSQRVVPPTRPWVDPFAG